MPTHIVVNSIVGSKFGQQIQAGEHALLADEPASVGGTDQGPTPYELLLSALGT